MKKEHLQLNRFAPRRGGITHQRCVISIGECVGHTSAAQIYVRMYFENRISKDLKNLKYSNYQRSTHIRVRFAECVRRSLIKDQ